MIKSLVLFTMLNVMPMELPSAITDSEIYVTNVENERIEDNELPLFSTYKEEIQHIRRAYVLHILHLALLGINVYNIEPVNVELNLGLRTEERGGYYVYATEPNQTVNRRNLTKNTIVLYKSSLPKEDNSKFDFYTDTLLHEYGHHIGFSKVHYNQQYLAYNKVRDNMIYMVDINYNQHTVEWRNSLYEQFAESYNELFLPNYENVSAAPNLTKKEKAVFKNLIREKFNTN